MSSELPNKRSRKQLTRSGKFFLRYGKGELLEIATYDTQKRQSKRLVGLGTTDIEAATLALKKYDVEFSENVHRKDMRLSEFMTLYYLKYANKLPSAASVRAAMRLTMEVWTDDPPASQLTAQRQRELIRALRARVMDKAHRGKKQGERRYADAHILKIQKCVWAAMEYCKSAENALTSEFPPVLPGRHWPDQPVQLRSRVEVYTLPELAKLFDAAAAAEIDNGWRYLLLSLGTGGRPTAVLTLTGRQLEFSPNLVKLLPAGRSQNKKRRPTVPMAPTLVEWAREWDTPGRLVTNRWGNPISVSKDGRASFKMFEVLSKRAGVAGYPYKLRHTVGTWLASQGADKWERSYFMGHREKDATSVDEGYEHHDPAYLLTCKVAIEKLLRAIDEYTTVRKIVRGAPLPTPTLSVQFARISFAPQGLRPACPSSDYQGLTIRLRVPDEEEIKQIQYLGQYGGGSDKAG